MAISIHALREEGDSDRPPERRASMISIHALREEGDTRAASFKKPHINFYPRPPRGGRPGRNNRPAAPSDISIHALREEGDLERNAERLKRYISIHALREEGDTTFSTAPDSFMNFYPRPPRGGRPPMAASFSRGRQFLSTPSARRATYKDRFGKCIGEFLSTPSARRATAKTETKSLFSNKLYNILHEFRRALIYNGSKSYPNHAK